MCGRYTITAPPDQLTMRFDAPFAAGADYAQRYNAAPTQLLPVITNEAEREIAMLRWGLIPSWTKALDNKYSMINARSETLLEKPSFKTALLNRRCLVLADSFYEWQKSPDDKQKTPIRITVAGAQPFAMAGLWDRWRNPAGEWIRSFTVITTSANTTMAPIHDRMPVILSREEEALWLDAEAGVSAWTSLLDQYDPAAMQTYAVSKRVNTASVDNPALIEPVA